MFILPLKLFRCHFLLFKDYYSRNYYIQENDIGATGATLKERGSNFKHSGNTEVAFILKQKKYCLFNTEFVNV